MAEKYCSKCGNQLQVDDKHCVKCGAAQQLLQQKIVAEEYKNAQTPSTEACSLCSFREKKQYRRAPFFKPAKQAHCRQNRLSMGSSSTPQKRMVLINVGIMERDNYSILKPARGKKLPLKLSETGSASEIKILAIDKQSVPQTRFGSYFQKGKAFLSGKNPSSHFGRIIPFWKTQNLNCRCACR